MIKICLHGAESTGKSELAAKLGYPWVPEFGRSYCDQHGTDLAMADLLAIAKGHDAATQRAAAMRPEVLILDTDPLMTAAWARMLFGEVPAVLLTYEMADLYLLFESDVPWIDDGTRFFGGAAERARFAAIAEAVLVDADVRFIRIAGNWAKREALARAAIAGMLVKTRTC